MLLLHHFEPRAGGALLLHECLQAPPPRVPHARARARAAARAAPTPAGAPRGRGDPSPSARSRSSRSRWIARRHSAARRAEGSGAHLVLECGEAVEPPDAQALRGASARARRGRMLAGSCCRARSASPRTGALALRPRLRAFVIPNAVGDAPYLLGDGLRPFALADGEAGERLALLDEAPETRGQRVLVLNGALKLAPRLRELVLVSNTSGSTTERKASCPAAPLRHAAAARRPSMIFMGTTCPIGAADSVIAEPPSRGGAASAGRAGSEPRAGPGRRRAPRAARVCEDGATDRTRERRGEGGGDFAGRFDTQLLADRAQNRIWRRAPRPCSAERAEVALAEPGLNASCRRRPTRSRRTVATRQGGARNAGRGPISAGGASQTLRSAEVRRHEVRAVHHPARAASLGARPRPHRRTADRRPSGPAGPQRAASAVRERLARAPRRRAPGAAASGGKKTSTTAGEHGTASRTGRRGASSPTAPPATPPRSSGLDDPVAPRDVRRWTYRRRRRRQRRFWP